MTANELATQIVDRRGGKAYGSWKQSSWLNSLLDKATESDCEMDLDPHTQRPLFYLRPTTGAGTLKVEFSSE